MKDELLLRRSQHREGTMRNEEAMRLLAAAWLVRSSLFAWSLFASQSVLSRPAACLDAFTASSQIRWSCSYLTTAGTRKCVRQHRRYFRIFSSSVQWLLCCWTRRLPPMTDDDFPPSLPPSLAPPSRPTMKTTAALLALLATSATAFAPVSIVPSRPSTTALNVAIDTSDIKNGLTVEIDGEPWKVLSFSIMKQARGAAKTTIKFKNLKRGNTLENTYRSGEKFETAMIEKKPAQYTYPDEVRFGIVTSKNINSYASCCM